jgi:hypothetical protein
MRRPSRVRIAGRDWRFRYRKQEHMDALGLTHFAKGLIDIATGMDAFDTRDTVLHEVMHALLAQQGYTTHGDEVEESFVRPLATGLIGVFQDNPELAEWFIERITKK